MEVAQINREKRVRIGGCRVSRLGLGGDSSSTEQGTRVEAQLKKANARMNDEKLAIQVTSKVEAKSTDKCCHVQDKASETVRCS